MSMAHPDVAHSPLAESYQQISTLPGNVFHPRCCCPDAGRVPGRWTVAGRTPFVFPRWWFRVLSSLSGPQSLPILHQLFTQWCFCDVCFRQVVSALVFCICPCQMTRARRLSPPLCAPPGTALFCFCPPFLCSGARGGCLRHYPRCAAVRLFPKAVVSAPCRADKRDTWS